MKTIVGLIAFLCLSVCAETQPPPHATAQKADRAVAVTIDDLPSTGHVRVAEINKKLLASFARCQIPALGFVNESRLYVRGETVARIGLLRLWLDAGHELGNHTYSHIHINNASLEEYQQDVIRGETVTRKLMQEKGLKLRYFRHPQLRTGPTPEYERALSAFLARRGYTVAPVTIDNQEWVYANAYAAARAHNDPPNVQRIAREYIQYMEECFTFFEQLSRDTLGYEVKQTLLLHANEINADHFDELAAMMKRRGYRFIPLAEALTDPAYQTPVSFTPRGDSWLHRWRVTKGLPTRTEPRDPEWLSRLLESYARR